MQIYADNGEEQGITVKNFYDWLLKCIILTMLCYCRSLALYAQRCAKTLWFRR